MHLAKSSDLNWNRKIFGEKDTWSLILDIFRFIVGAVDFSKDWSRKEGNWKVEQEKSEFRGLHPALVFGSHWFLETILYFVTIAVGFWFSFLFFLHILQFMKRNLLIENEFDSANSGIGGNSVVFLESCFLALIFWMLQCHEVSVLDCVYTESEDWKGEAFSQFTDFCEISCVIRWGKWWIQVKKVWNHHGNKYKITEDSAFQVHFWFLSPSLCFFLQFWKIGRSILLCSFVEYSFSIYFQVILICTEKSERFRGFSWFLYVLVVLDRNSSDVFSFVLVCRSYRGQRSNEVLSFR